MSFDFHYYPLVYRAGRESDAIPGLQVLSAPVIANRHRQHDLLALFLTISGDHRYDPEEIAALTAEAGQAFFQVPGSVTSAMQAVAEHLNKKIFDRNLDRGYEGVRAMGALDLAVIHKDWLFIGQVGRTQAIFINSEMVDFIDEPADAGDYLGLSRRVNMRLSQMEVKPDDLLLLCEQPPASWNVQNLAGSTKLSMIQFKRRLMNQVTGSLETVAIKFKQGRGRVEAGKWNEVEPQTASSTRPVWQTQQQEPSQASQVEHPEDRMEETAASQPAQYPEQESNPEERPDEAENRFGQEPDNFPEPPAEESYPPEDYAREDFENESESAAPIPEADQIPVIEGQAEDSYNPAGRPGRNKPLSAAPGGLAIGAARTWMKLKAAHEKVSAFFDRFTHRLKPAQPALLNNTPPLMLVVLSLVIPLVVILASITVYTSSGKNQEQGSLLEQAQQAAALAVDAKDVTQQRTYWAQALDLVTRAQEYETSKESQQLFEKAQNNLDTLDLAGRLDFRPALTDSLPDGIVITRIESSSSGVFLLDQTSGSVLRLSLNSKGYYELDSEFQCAPGPYGGSQVTNLIDFQVLPANDDDYRVVAIDAQGNLLYCRTDKSPESRTLVTPEKGWKRIIGSAYDNNYLYVLDADADAIWMYAGKSTKDAKASGVIFSEKPIKFFDENVPDLGGAIDLTVNDEDLYILHQDGHMTLCQYSAMKDVKSTECDDPAPYTDNRAGREKNPWIFMDSRFAMMQRTVMPNAAIYVLDDANRAIDQFSNQLNLEYVLKPQINRSYPMPDSEPTGFGVTSDLEVFLAYRNQLFIAPLK